MNLSRSLTLSCCLCGVLLFPFPSARADESGIEQVPAYGPVTDQVPDVLTPPDNLKDSREFTVAQTPPKITFSTLRGLPTLTDTKKKGGLWSFWGEGVLAANGKYYVGIGDHRGFDATTYVYEYDPVTHQNRQVIDVARLIGQKPGAWGHGKLHGRLDEMPDGSIYMATYWGEHPDKRPMNEQFEAGGRLLKYNTRTDKVEDLGIPLPAESWPMHATDTRRGIFHAIGVRFNYLAIDLQTGRYLYNGPLPGDVTWDERDTLVDEKTGYCYGSERHTRRIVGYDPGRNVFFHTKAEIPRHPIEGKENRPWLRAYTRRRMKDGAFICQTYEGVMFKFYPDEQRTEYLGLNWGEGLYTTSMVLSPDDQYLYFTVGAHGSTWNQGSPIIQMDTRTWTKKVIAFLHPYYQNKHGYVFGGSYSVALDRAGAKLVIAWNGRFRKAEETGESFGHPSFMTIEIPATERVVDKPKK